MRVSPLKERKASRTLSGSVEFAFSTAELAQVQKELQAKMLD